MKEHRPLLSLRLAFVLLLVSMELLRHLFPDSWSLGFWALVVDLLILLAIIGELVIRWLIGRSYESIDERINEFLEPSPVGPSSRTVEEISAGTGIKLKLVKKSLRRLKASHHADDYQGRWRKVHF